MRIVLISPEYPPAERMGGIGTNAATVAPALAGRGHDVFVVTRGNETARYRERGVEVLRLERQWLPNRVAERLLALARTAVAARRLRPDVVQAPEWEAEAWWLARWSRVPVVTRLATPTFMLDELNRGGPSPETSLVRRLERDQARRSAAVFAPTRALAGRVTEAWGLDEDRVRVIPSPVDVDGVRRAGAADPPVELPPRFLVFIGRMERRKGIEVLGEALPTTLAADPGLEAVLVGLDPGEEGGALMERFWRSLGPHRDRVRLLGELDREPALAVVARAELVVLPSLWENFANAALEAMALGRPLVATRTGGFPELVEDGRTGRLVPPADAQALAAAMTELLADEGTLRRLGEAAAEDVERFRVERIVDDLVGLYEQAAAHRPGDGFDRSLYRQGYRSYFKADEPDDPFHALYEAKRRAVLAGFDGGERLRILDAGGGYGRLAAPLARRHEVTLCDISPEMLAEARRRCPPGVRLVEADARSLPFADGEFDAVLALDLVPHLQDVAAGVRELARVVHPGGRLIFDTTNALPFWVLAYPRYVGWRPRRLLRTLLAGGVLPEWRRLVRHHRSGEVREAIAGAGLRLERVETFGPPLVPKWHLWWTTR